MSLKEIGEAGGRAFTIVKTYMIFRAKPRGEPIHQGTEPQLIVWLKDQGLSDAEADAIISGVDQNGSSEIFIR